MLSQIISFVWTLLIIGRAVFSIKEMTRGAGNKDELTVHTWRVWYYTLCSTAAKAGIEIIVLYNVKSSLTDNSI